MPTYRKIKTRKDSFVIPRAEQYEIDNVLRKDINCLKSEMKRLEYQNKTMIATVIFGLAWFLFFLIGYTLGWW